MLTVEASGIEFDPGRNLDSYCSWTLHEAGHRLHGQDARGKDPEIIKGMNLGTLTWRNLLCTGRQDTSISLAMMVA